MGTKLIRKTGYPDKRKARVRSWGDDTQPDCQASKPSYIGNTQLALDVGDVMPLRLLVEVQKFHKIIDRFAAR